MEVIKLAKQTLSFEELGEMLGPKTQAATRFLTYNQMQSFKNAAELFKGNYDAAIVLLQKEQGRSSSVGHFILLINYGDYIEHFDSYGLTIDEELNITHERHLTKFFNRDPKGLVQNTKQLQKYNGNINTCGRWVVARLLLRSLSLKQFLHFIDSVGTASDMMVTMLTALLPYKV